MTEDHEINRDENAGQSSQSGGNSIHRPYWQVVLLGFFTGIGGALIGVGGGIIMVPVLTMWGLTQKKAQGTSLVVILGLTPVAVTTYAVQGNIDFSFAIPLALGGVTGSVLGSRLALKFSNKLLARLFGIFLLLIVLRLGFDIVSGFLGTSAVHEIVEHVEFSSALQYLQAGLLGVLAGTVAGFFGVGGGVVFVPTGKILVGLTQHVAQGSSLTAMIPTAAVAARTYIKQKQVEWVLVRWMIPGAWVGAVLGAIGADVLGQIKNGAILTAIFAIFLLYTGVRKVAGVGAKKNNG